MEDAKNKEWFDEALAVGAPITLNMYGATPLLLPSNWQGREAFAAVYGDSATPTTEELKEIAKAILNKSAAYYGRAGAPLWAKGFVLMVLKKLPDGSWTYRKATWEVGPDWHPRPASLEEVLKEMWPLVK